MLQELILFALCYILVLVIYEIFIVNRAKKKKAKKYPMEVKYLIARYRLDMKKVDYPQLLQIVALVSSFDISLIVTLASILDTYLWQMIIVIILVFPVIFVSYHFVGKFYKKKGMTKDA